MTSQRKVVHRDSEIFGGTPGSAPVFQSGRFSTYLEAGETLDDFLNQFPSVKREQAVAVLAWARDKVIARARRS